MSIFFRIFAPEFWERIVKIMENAYRKLNAYVKAKELVVACYRLIDSFPKCENYALCDQLRRAIVSVPSNIAEGLSRYSNKEKVHFLEIAYGSLMESQCQLDIAKDLGYISEEDFNNIDIRISEVGVILSGMHKQISLKI